MSYSADSNAIKRPLFLTNFICLKQVSFGIYQDTTENWPWGQFSRCPGKFMAWWSPFSRCAKIVFIS